MKKKLLVFIAVTAVLVSLLAPSAFADCGPKASVTLTFDGIEGDFYVTLLSRDSSFGPHSAEYALYDIDMISDESLRAACVRMSEYADTDGYFFLGEVKKCSAEDSYIWGYYPPAVFKVLIYFAESDSFAVSETPLEQYAFSSYYEVGTDGGIVTARKNYNYLLETVLFLGRVCLTLAVELLVALPFGYLTGRRARVILAVNITTQVLLNLGLNIINFNSGWLAMIIMYFLLEVLVFIIEGAAYSVAFTRPGVDDRRLRVLRAWGYALAANLLSFAAGIGIICAERALDLI